VNTLTSSPLAVTSFIRLPNQ